MKNTESTYRRKNLNTHVLEADTTPQRNSCVFSEYYVESNEYNCNNIYQTDWRHSKSIQQSILSCGNSNEDCIRSLSFSQNASL